MMIWRTLFLLVMVGCSPATDGRRLFDAARSRETDPAPSVNEPCEFVTRLREVSGDFDPARDLGHPQSEAFATLANAPGAGTSFFIWGDECGGLQEPDERIRAIWTLWDDPHPDRAFAGLYLESPTGSTGQFAALIGLRRCAPTVFQDAAGHFEHTGSHFELHMYPSDTMCGTGWRDNEPSSLGLYIDGLHLLNFKDEWAAQVALARENEDR